MKSIGKSTSESIHTPVMVREILEFLKCQPEGVYFDGTFGGGGHTRAILEASAPQGKVIATDRDQSAIERGRLQFSEFVGGRLELYQGSFAEIAKFFEGQLNGALLDLGMSSDQLEDEARGFSFQFEAPLDMRMDLNLKETAADILNHYSESDLSSIFFTYGEERGARRIAREIVRERKRKLFKNTKELVDLICGIKGGRQNRLHPATKVFQALRIVVNGELDHLRRGLPEIVSHLVPGGRFCVISFHSLEDRIVKETFRHLEGGCVCPREMPKCQCRPDAVVRNVTKKPISPSEDEVRMNPRSRSAKLRVIEKR